MPGGSLVWRMRYRLTGRQEKVTFGQYPAFSLSDARLRREEAKAAIAHGQSPMRLHHEQKIEATRPTTVEAFACHWLAKVVSKSNRSPRNIERVVNKDIIPAIGRKRVADVTPGDVIKITDRIKARGSDTTALLTRNVLKRMFAYAIAREVTAFNPAAAIEARYIATAKSRDRALTSEEIGRLLKAVYASAMRRSHKLALHLLILCMVRKGELIHAKWDEIDFDKTEWMIPSERMKKDRAHVVYLSIQALALFSELRDLAGASPYVMPSRGSLQRPISHSTLNQAVRTMDLELQHFVLHDFRRTASTHLHEMGFNSDWIEKSLAHEQKGVRGVYNKAEYAEPRRRMLQQWADYVQSLIDERKIILGRFGGRA
jgi:integrase